MGVAGDGAFIRVPDSLRQKAHVVGGSRGENWAAQLPDVVRRLSRRWRFQVAGAFEGCHVSFVAPVMFPNGMEAALKVPMADLELAPAQAVARHAEGAALRLWDGGGAVRLLEFDESTGAMLLERCVPGTPIDEALGHDAADEVAAELLRRLWRPPPDDVTFIHLVDVAAQMAERSERWYEVTGQPFDRSLLDAALDVLRGLPSDRGQEVLLHGDTHHDNILSAARQPWLMIDPLPMIGEPAYDAVQFLLFRKGDLADPEAQWAPVVSRFCALVGVDEYRVLAWTLARLVSDALASMSEGTPPERCEEFQEDLWSARLVQRLLGRSDS